MEILKMSVETLEAESRRMIHQTVEMLDEIRNQLRLAREAGNWARIAQIEGMIHITSEKVKMTLQAEGRPPTRQAMMN